MTVEEIIRDIVLLHAPGADIVDDASLGAGGIGLDSIAIVEVLLACEERFGVRIVDELLDGQPLTPQRIADHVRHL